MANVAEGALGFNWIALEVTGAGNTTISPVVESVAQPSEENIPPTDTSPAVTTDTGATST